MVKNLKCGCLIKKRRLSGLVSTISGWFSLSWFPVVNIFKIFLRFSSILALFSVLFEISTSFWILGEFWASWTFSKSAIFRFWFKVALNSAFNWSKCRVGKMASKNRDFGNFTKSQKKKSKICGTTKF